MRLTSSVTENSTEYDQMNTVIINAQKPKIGDLYQKGYLYLLTLLLVLIAIVQSVRAETITIGKGTGVLWEGLPFDNSVVKIGNILATEATKVINNQVTWRLCSGGTSLPIGNVTASAEMLVTFN